jgi:hypothetical protein
MLEVDGVSTEEVFTNRPTYSFQLEAFRDSVANEKPVHTRGADSLKTITLLGDIRALANQE